MNRSWVVASIPVLVIVAAACGGKNGNHFDPVDSANAPAAGDSMGQSAEQSAGSFSSPTGPGFAPGAACQSGTVTQVPLQPTDADGDGIPDLVTVTYANCTASGPNGTEVINGTASITDGTPATADFDFTAAYNLTADLTGAGAHAGTNGSISISGTRSASGTGVVGSNQTFTIADATSQTITMTAPVHHVVSDAKTWNVGYTPSVSWGIGQPLVAGGMSISGSESVHVDGQGADATIASSGLQVSPVCATHIVAGAMTATYAASNGANAVITVTWNGCGNRTVVYQGP